MNRFIIGNIKYIFYRSMTIYNNFKESNFYNYLIKMLRIHVYNIEYEPMDSPEDSVNIFWYNRFTKSYCGMYNVNFLDNIFSNIKRCKHEYLFCSKNENKKRNICLLVKPDDNESKYFNALSLLQCTSELSTIRFMMIEYTHPGLRTAATINLTSDYYRVGNEILSDIFIEKYLRHNYGNSCIFNSNYTLSILDNNFELVTINQSNYIELKENSYNINCKYKY